MEEQFMKSFKKQVGGNHYKTLSIQPSKYIYYNQFNWYQGNVIKYVSRYNRKMYLRAYKANGRTVYEVI